MAICSLSAVVSGQRIILNHVDLVEFALTNPRGNVAHLPCRRKVNQLVHVIQLLGIHRRDLTPKTIAFAIPNENDEAEKATSHDCGNDRMAISSENNESSQCSDVEVVASISCSEEDLSQSAENLKSQGSLLDKLKAVHLHLLASERWNISRLKLCHRLYSESARSLIHYLALKWLDIEQLKEDLSSTGLLNLETINSYVLTSLTAGIQLLENLKSTSLNTQENISAGICTQERLYQQENGTFTIRATRKKLSSNKELLLGTLRDNRTTHIMVTVGQEATESETLITDLLKAGASVIRINCAHGNPSIWSEIIRRVKRSSQMLETPCRILMYLAGPKLRTGNLMPGPCVIKISPKKNATGSVIFPAQVWLSHKRADPPPSHLSPDAVLFIDDQQFLSKLKVGDTLKFSDARGKKRMLKISRQFHVFSGTGFVAECTRTAYVQSVTELYVKGNKGRSPIGNVVDVPAIEPFICQSKSWGLANHITR